MSVEHTFTCDGPECETHIKTQAEHPPTFLSVFENPGFSHELRTALHFCSLDCVLKYGAGIEPSERIEFDA